MRDSNNTDVWIHRNRNPASDHQPPVRTEACYVASHPRWSQGKGREAFHVQLLTDSQGLLHLFTALQSAHERTVVYTLGNP